MNPRPVPVDAGSSPYRVRLPLQLLVVGLASLILTPQLGAQALSIGILDIDRAMRESPIGKELAAAVEKIEEETRAAVEKIRQEDESLRQSSVGKSPDELVEIQRRLEDLPREVRRIRDDAQRRAESLRDARVEELNRSLAPVLNAIIDERSLDLVLNSSLGGILHSREGLDITDELIRRMTP